MLAEKVFIPILAEAMLQKLSIRNYALIDQLDIEFDNGLNIITGETGAGKSIILGALSLILGQRAESKYFFNQEKKCIIEGLFQIAQYHLQDFFTAQELDYDAETILRREISADGKSRSFVNDTPVNLSQLKQLSEKLIDIHSQHAILEVNDEQFQLLTIDSFVHHPEQLANYKTQYRKYKADTEQLQKLKTAQQNAASELDYHQFLFNELEAAAIKADEQEVIEQELSILNNAETIKSNLQDVLQTLSESEFAAIASIKNATTRLNAITQFDADIETLNQRLLSALIELKDIATELERKDANIHYLEEKTLELTARLDVIFSLQQKHRVTNNTQLLAVMTELSNKLSNFNDTGETISALNASVEMQKDSLMKQALQLSAARENVFSKVQEEIQQRLHKMGMPNAQLVVKNEKLAAEQFNLNGIDKISFQFSANIGQTLAPLNKIASGGELSRFMLAVKALISAKTALPTIIFDEIDTGISGDTAIRVGRVMEEMAGNMQVITITHLPQIAAKGETHFFVYKEEANKRTTTGIRLVRDAERVQILAEMLSGKDPGLSAIENARELLAASTRHE